MLLATAAAVVLVLFLLFRARVHLLIKMLINEMYRRLPFSFVRNNDLRRVALTQTLAVSKQRVISVNER